MRKDKYLFAVLLFLAALNTGCQKFNGGDETPAPIPDQQTQEPVELPTSVVDETPPTPTTANGQPTSATPVAVPEVLRFQFEDSETSETREGRLIAGQVNQFVFFAQAGQNAIVDLESDNDFANFSLVALDGSPPYKTLEDPGRSWQGVLGSTQEYMITVTASQATSYTITVNIETLAAVNLPLIQDPGSPPSDRCIVSHPGGGTEVTVYLGPSSAFAPIARLGNWAVVLSSENGWQQIQIGPGQTGWVRETEVVYSGPCDHVNQVIEFELSPSGSPYRNVRTLLPGQVDRYAFRGEAGSRVLIDLLSNDPVNFALVGVEDGVPLKRVASESTNWEGILPGSQEYMLTVIPAETAVDYELLVALVPGLPLTAVYDLHTNAILGGFQDAFWVNDATVAADLFGGELYDFYHLGQKTGWATGLAATAIEGICPGFEVQLSTLPDDGSSLAVAGAIWETLPRSADSLEPTELERQALADLLATLNLTIDAADLQIQEAYGVDLDGNGLGEVIILASRLKDNGSTPAVDAGDYFAAAVVMDIDGKLRAEPLILEVFPETDDLAYPWRYELSAVLDLNGDGVLEVVLNGTHWEGRRTAVYSVGSAGGAVAVLDRSCAE